MTSWHVTRERRRRDVCLGPRLVRGGPYPHIRANRPRVWREGELLGRLHIGDDGLSIRALAELTPSLVGRRLSKSTVHRRVSGWLYLGWRRCPACGRLLPDP
jgi:hypothetical protein